MSVILPDPNHPDYQRARVAMASHMFAIQRDEPKSGYGRMADALMCGDLMEVPTWLALGMLAQAAVNAQTTASEIATLAPQGDVQ